MRARLLVVLRSDFKAPQACRRRMEMGVIWAGGEGEIASRVIEMDRFWAWIQTLRGRKWGEGWSKDL